MDPNDLKCNSKSGYFVFILNDRYERQVVRSEVTWEGRRKVSLRYQINYQDPPRCTLPAGHKGQHQCQRGSLILGWDNFDPNSKK